MNIKLTTGQTIAAAPGQSILDALKASDIFLLASCGGRGSCGKCRIRILDGDAGIQQHGKLTEEERASGLALACKCVPAGDVHVEIPETSRLVVGDKIAFARAEHLTELFASFNVPLSPIYKSVTLHLPPPTLNDNISDLDRLRRALDEAGVQGIRFSHLFTRQLAERLRKPQWNITLGYVDEPDNREAVFLTSHEDEHYYGMAVDIGTTTVVVYLVDLSDGKLVDVGLTYNSQMRYGDDVITRIVHATEGGGLEVLRKAVIDDMNSLLAVMLDKHALPAEAVKAVTLAGNTTMAHLLWGLDPGHIREEPYIPTLNAFPVWKAGTAGIKVNPQAPVYTLPCVASYVGGDIVSGILATKMQRSEEIALFMDIGTNGEVALGNNEWIVTAACSAGPCFEGSGIRHGMRATEGAVEGVTIDAITGQPSLKVIGGGRPMGICGSGMIDAIAEMLLKGILNQKGKFIQGLEGAPIRMKDNDLEYVFFEDEEGAVTLTEVDIENIIRAKAAVYAGVSLLVAEMGMTPEDIQRVYIAGGFGNYLNIEKAIMIGMLPDLPRERFSFQGNTSVAGAYLSLLSQELRTEAEAVASMMTYIELSVAHGYMDEYMSAMFLPHTDMGKFPTVGQALRQ